MLQAVKEGVWEEQRDGIWGRPVEVMLRNCDDAKLSF
jgi:hypothetical protein